jgi:hypothetical protein
MSAHARNLGRCASVAEELPDIPSVREFVPGYEAGGWAGVGAPRNTPAGDAKCGFACHTIVKTRDYVFTDYGHR